MIRPCSCPARGSTECPQEADIASNRLAISSFHVDDGSLTGDGMSQGGEEILSPQNGATLYHGRQGPGPAVLFIEGGIAVVLVAW